MKHVLLVEPDYYSKYPPLGLLKLSTYHKSIGNTTELVKGNTSSILKEPDIIYVTSLFTWAWRPVWKAIKHYSEKYPNSEIWLGGLYASLMPEHAAYSGIEPSKIYQGIFCDAEDVIPDYTLVPEWNEKAKASIVFGSRGCIRTCPYCAVPKIEKKFNSPRKSIKKYIWPEHKKIIFFDNNFLANPYWKLLLNEVIELGLEVDFNQGLDARLITDEVATKLSELKIERMLRLSYDYQSMGPSVKNAIKLLESKGVNGRNILVYTLYNFTDSPDDFYKRMSDILEWGAVCYPQRYEPTKTRNKNRHISPKWDSKKLNAVQAARRIIGNNGVFLPHKGMLQKKVRECNSFLDAFGEFMEPLEEVC
ncbi:MAG: B12-binding domain-containing radical SAM protein [archaeon]